MEYVHPIRDPKHIEKMKLYLKWSNLRDYTLFMLGINTPVKVRELLALRVSDVAENMQINGYPLNEYASIVLEEYLTNKRLAPDSYLFPSRKGGKPLTRDYVRQLLKETAKSVGINDNIGSESLRKTFGYNLYQQGTDVGVIQQLLGHKTAKETLNYIGTTQDVCLKMHKTWLSILNK